MSCIQMQCFESCSPLTGKMKVPLDCRGDSASETSICFQKNKLWKFDLFWPFWYEVQSIFAFFCSNEVKLYNNRDYRVLRPKWTMKHVSNDSFENFGFGDLFWPELNMKQFHWSVPSPSPWEYIWKVLGDKCYVWGPYGPQPEYTRFWPLTWPWPDTWPQF